MSGDATILEGPMTPAPLFAYRAIRSIFFASPNSSPEYGNKENIIPTYAISPTKSKTTIPHSPQLTPRQKRKRDDTNGGAILSPTKGILRTPGLATPRAKYLKDVNVKFKSVSPEIWKPDTVSPNESFPKTKAQDAPYAVRSSKSMNDLTSSSKPAASTAQTKKQDIHSVEGAAVNIVPTTSYPLTPFAFEAYKAQTEKEMKKLVRYGQKMREYARKKDAENQELKGIIEDLRQENERLRRGGAACSADDGNCGDQVGEKVGKQEQKIKKSHEELMGKGASPSVKSKNRGYVREEVDRVEATVRSQVSKESRAQQRDIPAGTGSEERDELNEQISSRKTPASAQTSQRGPSFTSSKAQQCQPSQAESQSTATRSASASNTGSMRLPPDRLAAARDRLRRRAEARKASSGIEAAPDGENADDKAGDAVVQQKPPQETAKKTEPEKALEEPSEFDWANL